MLKTNFTKSIMTLSVVGLILTGCSKEDATTEFSTTEDTVKNELPKAISAENIALSLKADNAIEAMNNMSMKFPGSSSNFTSNDLVDFNFGFGCVDFNFSTDENGDKFTTVTFEDDCEIFGHTYKGKIKYQNLHDAKNGTSYKAKTYENFHVDSLVMNGTVNTARYYKLGEDPKVVEGIALTVTFKDGKKLIKSGEITRVWQGFSTIDYKDDAFVTTGEWSSILPDGNTYYYAIKEPLHYKYACFQYTKGIIDVKDMASEGVFDYGDGECDGKGTFTNSDGKVIEFGI